MKINHVSDLHGRKLYPSEKADVWVFSGDIFPDSPRTMTRHDIREVQWKWWYHRKESFRLRIGDAPVLTVFGNHDYLDLANLMRSAGINATEVTPSGVTISEVRFSGFGENPGPGRGESSQEVMSNLLKDSLQFEPHVLITHAPATSMCSGWPGIDRLDTIPLPKCLKWHLCGHIHEMRGKYAYRGLTVVNSSQTLTSLEV